MYHKYLNDERLYSFLENIDQESAEKVQEAKCYLCGGRLHVANYQRKPRGTQKNSEIYWLRYSLCCSRDGCRKRTTPPSVRFLGRKVYLGVVVALITALCHGPTPMGLKTLKRNIGVDRKTLKRWQKWWQEIFPKSEFWKEAKRQLFPEKAPASSLPESLLKVFDFEKSSDHFIKFLRFISPITAEFSISKHASLWPS